MENWKMGLKMEIINLNPISVWSSRCLRNCRQLGLQLLAKFKTDYEMDTS